MVAYSFKLRFVEPIRWGLGLGLDLSDEAVRIGEPKRQTIRAISHRRHARPGETLQLYTGMRTKQCKLIGEARCISVEAIRIVVNEHTMPVRLGGELIGGGHLHDFARRDGFDHAEDMHEFWKKEHGIGPFDGVLIRWEPLR
jgi:hypothetical protein